MSASAAEAAANEAMAGRVSVSDTSDSATRAARTLPSVAASSKGSALRGDAATFVSGSSSGSNLKPTPPANSTNLSLHDTNDSKDNSDNNNNRRQAIREQPRQRPIPPAEIRDPREFQISQLRRRFKPRERTYVGGGGGGDDKRDGTVLSIKLRPSDPDFPFELEALECDVYVPRGYLASGRSGNNDADGFGMKSEGKELQDMATAGSGAAGIKPYLRVRNKGMSRGYQINVERGFDTLVSEHPAATLLSLVNLLDRRLESFLAAPKAETVKLTSYVGSAGGSSSKGKDRHPSLAVQKGLTEPRSAAPLASLAGIKPSPSNEYSALQLSHAREKRNKEVRLLEARLGRMPLFQKSAADGTQFIIPVEPRARDDLPLGLQAVKTVKLHVPKLYDLVPCSIELFGLEQDAGLSLEEKEKKATAKKNVEHAFVERTRTHPAISLTGRMNYLTQNMHLMATEEASLVEKQVEPPVRSSIEKSQPEAQEVSNTPVQSIDSDKPHVKIISRPPEWDIPNSDESESESDGDYSGDLLSDVGSSDDEEGKDNAGSHQAQASAVARDISERGISVSFPNMEFFGIELLELYSLSITAKCQRCKELTDVKELKNNTLGDAAMRNVTCKKCSSSMRLGMFPLIPPILGVFLH